MVEVALDQCGPSTERKIALIDKNRDLYLTSARHLGREPKICKIGETGRTGAPFGRMCNDSRANMNVVCVLSPVGSMVHCMAWNDGANILCGVQDNQLTVWYYPSAVFTDKDLLPKTLYIKDGR